VHAHKVYLHCKHLHFQAAAEGLTAGSCRARAKGSNEIRALKKIKLPPSFAIEGFPMTSVREINLLLSLQHPNIVDVTEVVAQKRDVYMVMEYVQQDLKHFLEHYKTRLKIGEARFASCCSGRCRRIAPCN
jgi:cell division cycle 2-like